MSRNSIEAESLKRTPLYPFQVSLHAKFGSFGGWELPISYRSILQEHQAVRTRGGLFDVSHLGHLEVFGSEVLEQLQPLVTQDLARLGVSQACYTPMLNVQGGILDEMIVYRLASERFRFVVNASNGDKVLPWMRSHLGSRVDIEDLRKDVGTLAIQGPKAIETMGLVSQDPLADLPRYTLRAGTVAGRQALVARTGYTGEDGFELFVGTKDLGAVWQALLEAGRPVGIEPIGLGARDTLRLEAGLPLYGNDLDETTTPLEAGLEWTVAWTKGSFWGREGLERQRREGVRRRLVGFQLHGSGIPRPGYSILHQGKQVGRVTSGTMVPGRVSGTSQPRETVPDTLRGIGMGYVPPEVGAPGAELFVEIHGRQVPARVVKMPFYRRQK